MSEILFSPIVRPGPLEVNVPRPTPDPAEPSTEDDGDYLQEHLRLTRERIQELRGVFRGLHEPPRASQTSGADGRGSTPAPAGLDTRARFLTVVEQGESSDAGSKGLTVNLLV